MPELLDRLKTALADRYAIEHELGAGGMATVYLAEDLKHHRKVAMKVLRPELAAVLGAGRFVQEITTTANLQHPHILPLFDSGEVDSFLYYVMPFIDGETLRDKLNRETQFAIDEAVRIATEVADALDYAHRHDVIHRDIKPENILLHDGRPMVADFGIALAVSAAAGGRMTESGISLGTPHYMSPEQATAERELTNRSDVYSLGCVLYEMLTGEPPHTGASAQAIVMRIVTDDVRPVTELRKSVPPHVAAASTKALEKLPADRFQSAADFAEALANSAFTLQITATQTALRAARAAPWKRYAWPAAATLLLGLAVWGWFRPEPPHPVSRYGLALPPDQQLLDVLEPTFALAPDASWIVYVSPSETGGQLWVKQRDEYRAKPVAGTEGARSPIVSPDGEWIAFLVDGELRKVPAGGGSAITLADSVETLVGGAAWLDDEKLAYWDASGRLRLVPDRGGPSEIVFAPDTAAPAFLPTAIPGGRGVLFTACSRPAAQCSPDAWVFDRRMGEARMLMSDVGRSWYVATGHLVYVQLDGQYDGSVFAVPFDLGSLEIRGRPVPLLEGVKLDRGVVPDLALSETGDLLMLWNPSGAAGDMSTVVSVDRSGIATPIDPDWAFNPPGGLGMALSPDGTRVALNIGSETGTDIWVKAIDGGPPLQVTLHEAEDARPRWTPDGESVTFVSRRAGAMNLYEKRADGIGPVDTLMDRNLEIINGGWSPDATWLVLHTRPPAGAGGSADLWGFRPGIDTVLRPLAASEFDEKAFALSPNGRWLAYVSNRTGIDEVYVTPFPDTDIGRLVSTNGGEAPAWAHGGRELFYVEARGGGRNMMVATVETSPTFRVLERRALFSLGPEYRYFAEGNTAYSVTPEDDHFIMVRELRADDPLRVTNMILVHNWFEELKAKVGN